MRRGERGIRVSLSGLLLLLFDLVVFSSFSTPTLSSHSPPPWLCQRGARGWGEGGRPVWRGRSSLTYSKFFGKKSKLPLTLLPFFGVSIALSSSWSSLLLSLSSMR